MANCKGSKSDVRNLRNRYIYNEYLRIRATGEFSNVYSISEHISMHSRMPSHFLSEQSGKVLYLNRFSYNRIEAGKYKLKLVKSFLSICEKIRNENPSLPKAQIVRLAIEYPAPCCGLSPSQVYRILLSFGAF